MSRAADAAAATEDVVVVGAGPAGLGIAARLRLLGLDPLVLTAAERPGDGWRGHYERLHLHTIRSLSHLPGAPLPRRLGGWVAKDDLADYLDRYSVDHLRRLRVRTVVTRLERDAGTWSVRTSSGTVPARAVVLATGANRCPRELDLPGRDLFPGEVLHSSRYRTPEPYAGRRVLVVGAGNSGAEIAAQLSGVAAAVRLSVRTPPTIVPRSVGPVPVQVLGAVVQSAPEVLADRLVTLLSRLTVGDLTHHGMPVATGAPISRARHDGVTLTIDAGLLAALRSGRVTVVGAARRFTSGGVLVEGGSVVDADVVVAATGFRTGLAELAPALAPLLDRRGWPRHHQPLPGLFLHGFANEPGGNLRHFRRTAPRLARAVERYLRAEGGGRA